MTTNQSPAPEGTGPVSPEELRGPLEAVAQMLESTEAKARHDRQPFEWSPAAVVRNAAETIRALAEELASRDQPIPATPPSEPLPSEGEARRQIRNLVASIIGPAVRAPDLERWTDNVCHLCAAQVQEATAALREELKLERTLRASEKQAKIERGEMLVDAQDRLLASEALVKQMKDAVQTALYMHLGRCASSEPFKASDYRHHACEARDILRAALSAPAQDGEGQITDTQILDWLEKNRGEVREWEVGRWNASSPRVLYASQNSVREAVRFAIRASTEAKSLSAPDSTKEGKA